MVSPYCLWQFKIGYFPETDSRKVEDVWLSSIENFILSFIDMVNRIYNQAMPLIFNDKDMYLSAVDTK